MDLFIGQEGQMYQDTVSVYAPSGIPNPLSTICHAFVCFSVTADFRETLSIVGIPIVNISS
jgi:hypothetical protein